MDMKKYYKLKTCKQKTKFHYYLTEIDAYNRKENRKEQETRNNKRNVSRKLRKLY